MLFIHVLYSCSCSCAFLPVLILESPPPPCLQPANAARARELETVAQLLLFKFNDLKGRIKQVADRYLTKLVDK